MQQRLITALKKLDDYEPIIDDLHIEQAVVATICIRKLLAFLKPSTLTLDNYSRITDSITKLTKTRDNALNQLALTRRDRLTHQTQTGIQSELGKIVNSEGENATQNNR
jgi:hypothetical protein